MIHVDLETEEYRELVPVLYGAGGDFEPGIRVDGTIRHPRWRVYFERIEDWRACMDLLGWDMVTRAERIPRWT